MIHRQNKSLKKLVKTMNDLTQNVHDSSWISNTESMIFTIKQIQKEPITKARAIIVREMQDPSRVPTRTQRGHDPLRRRTSPAIRPGNAELLPASRLTSTIASPGSQFGSNQEPSYRVVENISRERQTTRYNVVCDYGDGNRERYERGSSSSSIRDENHPHNLFVPMPPFDVADWHARNKRKGGSGKTN